MAMEPEDLQQAFREQAEAVQAVVAGVPDFAGALAYAVALTREQGGTTIAASGLDENEQGLLREQCAEEAITLLTGNLRNHGGGFHTGFTRADWGIAATGTLVLDSSNEDVRLASMLCETHVAVLPRLRIAPDSLALETELDQWLKSPPRYLAFITGASRTADIERVLTIGVHGPQELHILVMEGDGA
jgi:L-lactate dehydrogenase complex protein LldG